ncbi:hypothetical protein GCM10023172_06300 [Hymenobacter ginsengisoli]|uniref:Uncharacterized protein n=1 Tax=Hymenobacter ginsengisoli TaxID=1051626 RepID=A0ABP8Q0S1_9BACT|nr:MULTISPECIES: hypothetical protein [unclassified Hymenobacter]MBO2032722.1 hypothetical protein [Hymenobacter sp. BT559]
MKTTALLLASALLLPAASAFAQSFAFTAPQADLQELVGCYPAAGPSAKATTPAAGSVTFFGVETSYNTQHEQFARLRQVFEASKPTVVLFEKPDVGIDTCESLTITRLGESGYVRYLAQQHGVRAERLDDPEAEYAYLRTRAEATQLKLYYLLRACQQYRQNTGATKALTMKAMQQLIANSATFLPGTEGVVQNLDAFTAAYRQHCPTSCQWWQRPLGAPATEAFMQHLDDELRAFRAQRLSQQVATHIQAGERVLVVLDRSHLPAPATYAATMRAPR